MAYGYIVHLLGRNLLPCCTQLVKVSLCRDEKDVGWEHDELGHSGFGIYLNP